jgi:serine/threonine protein kinase
MTIGAALKGTAKASSTNRPTCTRSDWWYVPNRSKALPPPSSHTKCIYAVLGRVILGPDDDFRLHESKGALPALIRLQRQISYFGDKEGLNGLVKHVGDEEANCEILKMLWKMLWEERAAEYIPYVPFAQSTDVDSTFKDLVCGLNNLDPSQRLTARQALEHPWFNGIENAY